MTNDKFPGAIRSGLFVIGHLSSVIFKKLATLPRPWPGDAFDLGTAKKRPQRRRGGPGLDTTERSVVA